MTSNPPTPVPTETSTTADHFFSAAIPRMLRFLLILGAAFTLGTAWRFGLVTGLGFAAGAVIAYLSFRSLSKAVQSLASRIVDAKQPDRGFSLVSGFFLRYLLAGIVAYVIFTSSSRAFRGFLFGLCTPVAAMLLEAGFEAYAALRRGY
jgi:ATP synthase I chain